MLGGGCPGGVSLVIKAVGGLSYFVILAIGKVHVRRGASSNAQWTLLAIVIHHHWFFGVWARTRAVVHPLSSNQIQ
jgi:hypothetical protein